MAVIVFQAQAAPRIVERADARDQPGPAAIPAAIGALDVKRHRDAGGGAFAHVHHHRRPAHLCVRGLVAHHPSREGLAAMAGQRLPERVMRRGWRRGGAGRKRDGGTQGGEQAGGRHGRTMTAPRAADNAPCQPTSLSGSALTSALARGWSSQMPRVS